MLTLKINGKELTVDVDPNTPLLWVIRDELKLTGTKYGCGKGLCGSCTVHFNGQALRACTLPVVAAQGQEITTIEGVSDKSSVSYYEVGEAVQEAWVEEQVPQCGYCQPGQIMSATALLSGNEAPSDDEIDQAMRGNICRCGTYPRIKKAIKRAAEDIA